MDNTNSKILTISLLAFSALVGFTVSSVLKVFSGAFGIVARAMEHDLFRHGLPIAVALGLLIYLQFNKKVHTWAEEVIAEIRKVVWPTGKDTRGMTIVVIIMVLISSLIIGVFDTISAFGVNQLIK